MACSDQRALKTLKLGALPSLQIKSRRCLQDPGKSQAARTPQSSFGPLVRHT